jgi:alanyl aminopeptidase
VDGSARAAAVRPPAEVKPVQRLPSDVTPLSYALELRVDPSAPRFSGRARIATRLTAGRRVVWLHGRDLRVSAAHVAFAGKRLVGAWKQEHEDGLASLTLPEEVGPGDAELEIEFDAALGKVEQGLFRADADGRAFAFTQFEAVDARRAFPCFDEPGWKTPFRVTLVVPKDLTAFANTRPERIEPLGDQKRIRFGVTEKLPTYLVAFGVGAFEIVEVPAIAPTALRPRPLPLRGIARKGKGAAFAWSLAAARELVPLLEQYFGIAYPYDKLDLIAISDFFGAMENAGAITFGEQYVLVDPKSVSAGQSRRVAETVAHEIAHQWFGNLVTMRWWDDLWLNEAFATWMAERTVEEWRPRFYGWLERWEQLVDAMALDAVSGARQIRQPIASPHDIEGAFDDITYAKGARVISMFERYLGAEVFRAGVRTHMKRFSFGSATSDDFMASLSSGGKDMRAAFRSFLDQPGIPYLETEVSCTKEHATLRVRQSRYLPVGSDAQRRAKWTVPLCVRYGIAGATHEECTLLSTERAEVRLAKPGCPTWLHPNADGAGYVRFALTRTSVSQLLRAWPKFSTREKMTFVGAALAAFELASLPFDALAPVLERAARSKERGVARLPMSLFVHLAADVVPELAPRVREWAARLYAPQLERLGLDPKEDVLDDARRLRRDVVGYLARDARVPRLREELLRRVRPWIADAARGDGASPGPRPAGAPRIEPELVETAIAVAANDGDEATFAAILRALETHKDAAVRRRLAKGLVFVSDPKRAARTHALFLQRSLRAGDLRNYFRELIHAPEARPHAWRWLERSFDAIAAKLPPNLFGVGELPRYYEGACTDAAAADLERLFRPRVARLVGAPRNLDAAVQIVRTCAKAAAAQRENVRAFFSKVAR